MAASGGEELRIVFLYSDGENLNVENMGEIQTTGDVVIDEDVLTALRQAEGTAVSDNEGSSTQPVVLSSVEGDEIATLVRMDHNVWNTEENEDVVSHKEKENVLQDENDEIKLSLTSKKSEEHDYVKDVDVIDNSSACRPLPAVKHSVPVCLGKEISKETSGAGVTTGNLFSRNSPSDSSNSIKVKKVVLPIQGVSSHTAGPSVNQDALAVAPTEGESCPRIIESDPRVTGISTEQALTASPSVLRTLLLASGKQLMLYRSHDDKPEDVQCTTTANVTSQDAMSEETSDVNLVKQRNFGCQANLSKVTKETPESETVCNIVERKIRQRHPSLSQMRALLLGHKYERVTPIERTSCGEDNEPWIVTPSKRSRNNERLKRSQEYDLSFFLAEVVDLISEYKDLVYSVQKGNRLQMVEVRRKGLYGIPSPGFVPAQVIIDEEGNARFLTLIKSVVVASCKDECGRLKVAQLRQLLQKLSIKGGHVFCPGVEQELASISPDTKDLIRLDLYTCRYQARECPIWYMLPSNQSWLALNDGIQKCKMCKNLERYLRMVKKARERKDADGGLALEGIVNSGDYVCVWTTGENDGEDDEEEGVDHKEELMNRT